MSRPVSKVTVRRIRWHDPESDDPSTPVDWPIASLILATLFLNFSFMNGVSFWLFCPLPLFALLVGAVALLVTTLFFMGPALATHAAGRPLLLVIADSIGSVPAFGLRLCCVLYLVLWIANLVAIPPWWWGCCAPRWWWACCAPMRQISLTEFYIFVAVLPAFLFVTGRQSLRTRAKLALFSNKLAVAILIAALIRVHQGLPVVLGGHWTTGGRSWGTEVWEGLSDLAFYVAPLGLVAASFGHSSHGRRQVVATGLMGVALPLFATLLLVGVIGAADFASPFSQPSLQPTVAAALSSNAARSALPARMMIAAITVFGVARFGVAALAEAAGIPAAGTRRGWALLACFIGATAWLSLHQYAPAFTAALDLAARCLGVTGTVITVDFLFGRRRVEQARKVDWVGLIALLAGLATPLYLSYGILPSCFVGFLVCLCGRVAQKMPIVKRFDTVRH
jgi:hypothetical protein